ncbi:hypothetical protein NCC49_004744 [Naganishia albida]|nr:hypothetical protein NCC49_004744 [Naganishia albida]
MPIKQTQTPYPLIDADPHAGRVIRYMRPSDYAVWAGSAAAAPALLLGWEKIDPTFSRGGTRSATKLLGFLGFCGGFMLAYQRSSFRFMGLSPNEPEVTKDARELSARAAAGKPIYGETDLSEYLQGVAARNSTWSQLKLGLIPWFNVVNHNQHGVDTSKYTKESS